VFQFEIISQGTGAVRPGVAPAKPAFSRSFAAGDVLNSATGSADLGPFSLDALAPGYYQAVLTVFDTAGRPTASRKENFVVLSTPRPTLPLVFSRPLPPFPSLEPLFMLATQYFASGRYGQAKEILDKAAAIRDDPRVRLLLGRTLYALNRYKDSIGVLDPLSKIQKSRDAAKVLALDYSGLGDWAAALAYCRDLLKEGTEVSVLNLAGECYIRVNQPEQAVPLLRKSLEIEPAQPAVKALLEQALKK
jgi:tetratricopeptide (TPR) repeat protein